MRNNGLTFPLIKNEYIYTQNGHCRELPKTQKIGTILELAQNTKIGNNPRIRELQQNRKLQVFKNIKKIYCNEFSNK